MAQQTADTFQKKECPTRSLPKEYDEWKQLTSHNQYLYYTTHVEEVYLQCLGKERFTITMGIVRIPPGCSIHSRTGVIYGSTDKTAAINRQYAVMTEITDSMINETQSLAAIAVAQLTTIQDNTDNVLKEAVEDLAALDASSIWMWVAIVLGNIIAVATATIIMWYCCKKRSGTANNSTHQNKSNQGVTLEMTSTTNVIQNTQLPFNQRQHPDYGVCILKNRFNKLPYKL